jgi:transcriptional regulator with XRE-family HTH domain
MDQERRNTFGRMLAYYRLSQGLSQSKLAKELNLSASAIGLYEQGRRHPDFETEELIADYFNVDLNTLRGVAPLSKEESTLIDHYRKLDDKDKAVVERIIISMSNNGG